MARVSFRSIIVGLLQNQPALSKATDDEFLEAVRNVALSKGYRSDEIPRPWNLLRTRFAVIAEFSGKSKKRLPKTIENLVEKARLSALEAVASYNNPMSPFRSGSFIIHMHIAWNSMLLGIFLKKGGNCSRVCWLEIPINWLTHQFDQCGKDVFTFEPRCRDDRLQGG
ncbi:MAG: DUF3644 domain-containing protein, partial [Blastocatellales bacterium]